MLYDSRDSADALAPEADMRPAHGPVAADAAPTTPDRVAPTVGAAAEGRTADILSALGTAALSPDREEGERQLRALLDSGVSREALIDRHIPEAARDFGTAWSFSDRSFAEVTVAVARLQGWLRDLEPGNRDAPFDMDAPEVLLVVADGTQHTLGAMVAMSRFRRLGSHVRLSMGQPASAVADTVRRGHVDMVALSGASGNDLDFLARLAHLLLREVASRPKIVVGGEILNQMSDVAGHIGADIASSDPEEALTLCGLTVSKTGAPARATDRPTSRGQPERVPTRA